MPRRKLGERCVGPYPHRRGWRLRIFEADGTRRSRTFSTRARAEAYKQLFSADAARGDTTVDQAIEAYEKHLRDEKQNKPKSYTETLRRLRRFFPDGKLELDMLTPVTARAAYKALVDAGLAADSHRNMLAEAKTFLRWCMAQHWIARSPLEEVKGTQKRRHGKKQLRLDEARAWAAKAHELAGKEQGAVAALLTLYLGLRVSEVVKARVRDVDDGARLFWVEDTKTEAGRRQLEVPKPLHPHLARLAKGRAGSDWLFAAETGRTGHHDRKWPLRWVRDICIAAGVTAVTAHGMRGLLSTMAVEAGLAGHLVAATMGHESFSTTARSYADRHTVDRARRRKAIDKLGNDPQIHKSKPKVSRSGIVIEDRTEEDT